MAAKDTNKILKFPQKKSIHLHIKKSTAAKAEIKNHDYYIRDEYLKGFFLRIRQSGKKTYNIETKIPKTNQKYSKVIGDANLYSETEARELATKYLKDIKQGKNPGAINIARKKEAISLIQILEEYIDDRGSNLKASTVDGYRYNLKKFMPLLSKKPIGILSQEDFIKWFKQNQSKPIAAERTFSTAKTLMNYAVAKKYIEQNVAAHAKTIIGRYGSKSQIKTHISLSQMPSFLDALFELNRKESISSTMRDYFVLMLVTGLRKTEAASITWDNVNFNEKTFSIPDNKPGRFLRLPMNRLTYDLFKFRKNHLINETYVFPNIMNTGYVTDPNKSLDKISKLADLGFNLRCHDFRRTFSTLCNELGINLGDAGVLLNHAKRNVTDNYVIRSLEFQRDCYDRIVLKIESYINSSLVFESDKRSTQGLTNAFRVFFYEADQNELISETLENHKEYWNA